MSKNKLAKAQMLDTMANAGLAIMLGFIFALIIWCIVPATDSKDKTKVGFSLHIELGTKPAQLASTTKPITTEEPNANIQKQDR